MAAGDRWKQRITVPAMDKGYYQVALTADTEGPPGALGPFLSDDVYREAWMFISDRGATLTEFFDASVFPEGVRPEHGPIRARNPRGQAAGDGQGGKAVTGNQDAEYVWTEVVYSDNGFQPAIGIEVIGHYYRLSDDSKRTTVRRYVPESGYIRWDCPSSTEYLGGDAEASATLQVNASEEKFNLWWDASHSECGDTVMIFGDRQVYLPWNNLDKAADLIEDHFGYSRSRISWKVNRSKDGARYRWGLWYDHIEFGRLSYHSRWIAAHEFTHALHHKALDGSWRADNCNPHYVDSVSSYKCAFKEGLADYGGNIGSPDTEWYDWENWSTTTGRTKGKIEGYVAALFHDLLDDETETGDYTEYSGTYVFKVFKTCRVKTGLFYGKRTKVSDFVWCLENRINKPVHRQKFPGTDTPKSVKESATEPDDWDATDIRNTWTKNVG